MSSRDSEKKNAIERSLRARRRLLQMHFESRVGHIGGNLSCLEILLVIHHEVLTDGDEFVLSKGHAAGALYVALWSIGVLTDDDLRTFHQDNTLLSGHPPSSGLQRVSFATGSLGHGIGLAAGVALAKKLKSSEGRVVCLTSDGEWNEGSAWESLIFSIHHKLNRLTIIVDQNGLQGFGTTKEVADLGPLSTRFRAFGAKVVEVSGHDPEDIFVALSSADPDSLLVVIAKTIKGFGVSFMENRLEWHYLPLSPEQYELASHEVSRQ